MKNIFNFAVCAVVVILFQSNQGREISRDYHPQLGSHHSDSAQNGAQTVDWIDRGKQDLAAALGLEPKWKPAKNLIFFHGDGMGISTQTPARIYKAQKAGQPIPDTQLSWEEFPYAGLLKTYNTDYMTPDSAGTATAFLSGEKTRSGVIGVNQNVPRGACNMTEGNEVRSLFHYAMDEGTWAGIVTTGLLAGATVSSAYAHSAERDWQTDKHVREDGWDPEVCWDLTRQLIHSEPNDQIRVLLAGGRKHFFPEEITDPEYPSEKGERTDGRDLRQEWLDIHHAMQLPENSVKYVENKTDFDAVDSSTVEYLFGLFEYETMKYEAHRQDEQPGDAWTEPSLAEMVRKSLDILKRGPNGYVLIAEGDLIDSAHHATNAYLALEDTLGLEEAVKVAMDETDEEDTLIIVTADHSHTLTMAGYQLLDTDILGTVIDDDGQFLADDMKPLLTLSYANGPGYYDHRTLDGTLETESTRLNLTGVDTTGSEFRQDTAVPKADETHSGEDVAVYARGPMAHLFGGLHEQSYIAHAMMYTLCVGWNQQLCVDPPPVPGCSTSDAPSFFSGFSWLDVFCLTVLSLVLAINWKSL